MANRVSVAVVGATGVVGEPLLTALEARNYPVANLYCLDEGDAVGERLRYFGKSVTVTPVAEFDFTQVELVFFCSEAIVATSYALLATEAGCTVIDCSGAFGAEYDVPMVIPEVNPQALEDIRESRIIANPSAATIALLLVIKPLLEAVGITRINITTLEPVSVAGKAGVDELAAQTVALLNMKEAASRVFPQQIAFNVVPQIGSLEGNGYTDGEMKLVWETQKVLGRSDISLNPTAVLVPVFFGCSMAVHLECHTHLSATEAQAMLATAPGVSLVDSGTPTPVGNATKDEAVYVGRLREDISQPNGLDLWITMDNVRKGAALNAVQIAELWEKMLYESRS